MNILITSASFAGSRADMEGNQSEKCAILKARWQVPDKIWQLRYNNPDECLNFNT
jgi:hypothetical protein